MTIVRVGIQKKRSPHEFVGPSLLFVDRGRTTSFEVVVEPEFAVAPLPAVPEQTHDMSAFTIIAKNCAHEVYPRPFPRFWNEMWILVEGLTDLRIKNQTFRVLELGEKFFPAYDCPTDFEAGLEYDSCEIDFGERETFRVVLLRTDETRTIPRSSPDRPTCAEERDGVEWGGTIDADDLTLCTQDASFCLRNLWKTIFRSGKRDIFSARFDDAPQTIWLYR